MQNYKSSFEIIMMTAAVLILLFTDVLFSAEKIKIRMATAASLIPVMDELETVFEKENPLIDLEVIYGASGNLTSQIINGAPFDIFASADMEFPERLNRYGLVSSGPEIYAEGLLVLFTVRNIDLKNGIFAVKGNQVKKISLANPDTAPYGRAAVDALKKAGLYNIVKNNLVYAGNISQTAQYVVTGADIGFVGRSLMYDPMMKKYKENINWVTLPENISTPLKQGVVLLSRSKDNANAVKAYKFMLSKKAKAVFVKYGYR